MTAACYTNKVLLLVVMYLACSPAGTDGDGEGRHGEQKVNMQDIHVHRADERRPSVPSSSVPPATETTRETARQEGRNETTFNSTKQPGNNSHWNCLCSVGGLFNEESDFLFVLPYENSILPQRNFVKTQCGCCFILVY